MFKVNKKKTRTTSLVFLLITFKMMTFSMISVLDFEQVRVSWEVIGYLTLKGRFNCHNSKICESNLKRLRQLV